jgi:hypothetical protein
MDDSVADGLSAVEAMRRRIDAEYADYDFCSAEEVFGERGADLVAWWARALAERARIHLDHYADAADTVIVEFSTTPQRTMHYGFYGLETWIEDWSGSFDDARQQLADSVRDFAGQVKEARNRSPDKHHPWDDAVDA